MNRQSRSAASLAGALLVAALVAVACGRGGYGSPPAGTTPEIVGTPSASLTPAETNAVTSPEASDAASPLPTYDPGTTIDDVDSDLHALDQILGGVDGSVSGAGAGANGGE